MQNYKELINRYEDISEKLKKTDATGRVAVTRAEVENLVKDMATFVGEDHPRGEKATFFPLGYIEVLNFFLDDSGPDDGFRFADE